MMTKATYYHVRVIEIGTCRELAKYTYTSRVRAVECKNDVYDVRVKQNHEHVVVRMDVER